MNIQWIMDAGRVIIEVILKGLEYRKGAFPKLLFTHSAYHNLALNAWPAVKCNKTTFLYAILIDFMYPLWRHPVGQCF